jgi:hypothetical protein
MKAIPVNRYLIPVLAVLALLGSVWVAKAAGAWQVSGRGVILVDESGEADPQGIKGWMTLSDVSSVYGVPLDALYTMIGTGAEVPPDTALKDLEKLVPGMEVWAVRAGVEAYQDGSWTPEDRRYTGDAVEDPPQPTPTLTPEPKPPAEEHVPQGPGAGSGEGGGEGFTLPQDGSRLPGSEIRGRMTLREVADYCQIPFEALVAELGLPGDIDTHLYMRDLAGQYGIEVTTVREVVERYQAQH